MMEFITACFFDAIFSVQKINKAKNKAKIGEIYRIEPVFLSSQFYIKTMKQLRTMRRLFIL